MTKEIKLTRGYIALVDDDMFDYFNQWWWNARDALHGYVYAVRMEGGKSIFMHRVVISAPHNILVDHIDNNTLNNQRNNLRCSNRIKNARNRKGVNKNNTSGYRNVFRVSKYWRVRLWKDGKHMVFPEKFTDIDKAGNFAEKMRKIYYKED